MSRNVSGGDSGSMSWTRPSRLAASSRKRSRRSPPSAAPAAEPAGAASSNTAITSTRRPARNPRIGRPGIGLWYNSRVRSPAVPVLDRYVIRELISPFLFGGALFTFFLVIDRIYQLTELVITKGVPFHLVVQLLVFMLPSFLAHTLPMALLVAVLLAGGRLAGDLEIIAFKAAGVSVLRLFRPVVLAALIITAATALLTLVVNPLANEEFQRQLFRILQTRAMSGLQERVFNATFGDVIIYVEDVSASQVALRGLLVSDERDPKISRIITAREGRLLTDEANRRITLRLLNGAVNEADVLPAAPPPLPGVEQNPAGGAAAGSRYRLTNFAVYDMSLSVDSPLKSAPRLEKPEKDLSLGALLARIGEFPDPYRRAPYEVELHKRFAFPIAALVFALVAFPLAVRSHRGGRSIALVASLVILVSYYMLMTSLERFALAPSLPAWVAIWTPNILFGVIGLTLLVATAREWQAPRLLFVWRALAALRRLLPRAESSSPAVRAAHGPSDSTHILDRYLMREFLTFLGIGLAVAAALYVIVDLGETLNRFLRVKPPLVYILEHFVYRLPVALHEGLPVIMLVATIFLFLSLSRFHELTAMKAAGISLYRVSAPILLIDRGFRLVNRLDARHAHWTEAGWELRDGDFREIEAGGTVLTVPFTLTALDLAEDIEAMSYWELRDYVTRLEAAGFQVKKYLVALYSKLSFPLVNLVMVLVAIPFALQSPRGGRLFGVGLAIAIMAGYLVVHYVALAFARADLLPPFVAAWTANVIFLGIGSSLFLRART